jgi:signal peptidase I
VRGPRRRLPIGRFAAIALIAAAVGALGYLRTWPPVNTVMSGSMEPTIHTGDMVVLKRLDRRPRIGDVVAIGVPDAARARYGYPPVVVHRIRAISPSGQVTTRGDAMKSPDPFTTPVSHLQMSVVARIPAGGHVLAFFSSGLGLLWLAAGGVLLFGLPLLERSRDAREEEAATGKGLRTQLEAITEELVELRLEQIRERAAQERRFEELSRTAAAQLEAVTTALLERLPAQVEAAVSEAVTAQVSAATAFWTIGPPAPPAAPFVATIAEPEVREPEPEPEEEPEPLTQLALALVPETRLPLAADESAPQLAFALDVETRARFQRPCEDQLAFVLDDDVPSGQLKLSTPPPSRWDAPPPVVRRRSGGLVGQAISAWRIAAQVVS